jgi:DNA polymerase-3 subunit gamma/tau
LLFDAVQAVADENAIAAFDLTGRAVEMGYDLRAVCRELSRVVRDLLVLTVDPSRIGDGEIAAEGERDRLTSLAARFSREDLLRAFDLLTRAESEIRGAAQPRHHLEMALLRWIHLRKLAPIEELIAGVESGKIPGSRAPASVAQPVTTPAPAPPGPAPKAVGGPDGSFRDRFLAEVKKAKPAFYNMVVVQAQAMEIGADRVAFTFSPAQRTLSSTLDQHRAWLEGLAEQIAGRRMSVVGVQGEVAPPAAPARPPSASPASSTAAAGERGSAAAAVNGDEGRKSALRERALADAGVQALLEVFPAEIRDVEEM